MPYALQKVGRKYQVVTVETGKTHSKEPMKKKDAEAQLRILNAAQEESKAQEQEGGFLFSLGKKTANTLSEKPPWRSSGSSGLVSSPDAVFKNCGINEKGKQALNIMQYVDITGISALVNFVDDLSKSDCSNSGYVPPTDEEVAEMLANERWRSGNKFIQQDILKQYADQKAGVGRVYTEDELQAAQNTAEANLLRSEAAAKRYELHQKMSRTTDASKRNLAAIKTDLEQQITAKKATEAAAAARAAAEKTQAQAFATAREKQQALAEINTGFRTKAIQIAKEDFFAQERLDQQAREAALEAERRRNALRASTMGQPGAPASAAAAPTVRPIGFRLPPPVLTPRR
jgi:hypothetical protein